MCLASRAHQLTVFSRNAYRFKIFPSCARIFFTNQANFSVKLVIRNCASTKCVEYIDCLVAWRLFFCLQMSIMLKRWFEFAFKAVFPCACNGNSDD